MKFKIRIKHNQFKLLHNQLVIKIHKKNYKVKIIKRFKKWKIQKNQIKVHKNKISLKKRNKEEVFRKKIKKPMNIIEMSIMIKNNSTKK